MFRSAAYGGKQFTYLVSCEGENPIQVLHQLFESGSVRRHSMPAISHHHIAVRNTHLLGLIKITRPPHKPFHAQPVLPFAREAESTHSSAHGPLNPQTWAALPALRGAFYSCPSLAQCLNFLFVGSILWPRRFKGNKLHTCQYFLPVRDCSLCGEIKMGKNIYTVKVCIETPEITLPHHQEIMLC